MKTFEGFSLEQSDAFANISLLIETGMLLTASTNERTEEIGDIVLGMAKKYSQAASQKYVYGNHSTIQQTAADGATTQRPTIGFRIQIARENLDMSEDDLAEKLNIHPGDVLTWEDGTDQPLAGMIIPLSTALKCDPMWLLTGNPLDVKAVQPAPQPVPSPAPVNVMKGADLANIGVRIESRRNYIEMSLNKLAEEIDTSGAMIREWETGKAIPHSDYIDRLAKALNTTVTWLMTGKAINDAGIK